MAMLKMLTSAQIGELKKDVGALGDRINGAEKALVEHEKDRGSQTDNRMNHLDSEFDDNVQHPKKR